MNKLDEKPNLNRSLLRSDQPLRITTVV